MADLITRMRIDSAEYDQKLKRATQNLLSFEKECASTGESMNKASKENIDYIRALGNMQTVSTSASGKVRELSSAFVDLSAQYNRMSDDVKNGDVGRALSASLEQIKQRAIAAKKELSELQGEVSGLGNTTVPGEGFSRFDGMLSVLGGNLMTKGIELATSAVTSFVGEIGEAMKQGVQLAKQGEGIRIAFERLGRGDILQGLRDATHGTVTDIELMKAAVKFNDFKLPIEELGTMLAFAQQKAKDTGQSVDYMVDSIVTGLGRKSLMILDNLGLSAAEIKEKMAETGDMTKAVGAIIREQMAAAGEYVETAADRATAANVSMQNKMEELGRKFVPLEQASTNFWTSMKISILDIIGGPLATLMNKFTEAGRQMNALSKMNGDGTDGEKTTVQRQLSALRGSNYKNAKYNATVQDYQSQIQERKQAIEDWEAWRRGDRSQELEKRIGLWREKYGTNIASIRSEVEALTEMLQKYQNAAKAILKPIEPEIETEEAEKNVEALKLKLIELQAQQRKAIQAGDTDLSKNLQKQINQTKADIKVLDKNAFGDQTHKALKTEEQRNTARIGELTKQYQDLATQAKTADEAQKAGISERMNAIKNEIAQLQARNKELKKFADEAKSIHYPADSLPQLTQQLHDLQQAQSKALNADEWKRYQDQIDRTQLQIDALKGKWKDGVQATFKMTVNAEQLEKLKAQLPKDATITVNTKTGSVEQPDIPDERTQVVNVEAGDVQQPDVPTEKEIIITADTAKAYNAIQKLSADIEGKELEMKVVPKIETGSNIQVPDTLKNYISDLQKQLSATDVTSTLYADLSNQLSDMTTLQTLVGESLKQGLGTAMFDTSDELGSDFWTRAMEGGVENIDWQSIVDKINEARKEAGLDNIEIDFTTGKKLAKGGEEIKKSWMQASSAVKSVSGALQQIDDPSAKILGIVGMAIAEVSESFGQALNKDNTLKQNIWAFIGAAAASTATMMGMIASIKSATSGYAEGGIIKGSSYSGDNILGMAGGTTFGLNAGELILNRSQQHNLANDLINGGNNSQASSSPYLTGEVIILGANNHLRRSGQGEIVTTSMLRRLGIM